MGAAGSPPLKRQTEQSQDDGEATAKKPKMEDNLSFRNDTMVSLEVGPERVPFQVHKNLLCDCSPFFEAAFNGHFKEKCGSMELKEDDVDAFEYFMQWLYRRKINVTQIGDPDYFARRYTQLSRLYTLADKYGVALFKNHIMTLLFDTVKHPGGKYRQGEPAFRHYLPMWAVQHVYANTVEGSPIRKFLAAVSVWPCRLDNFELKESWRLFALCPEFMEDLGVNLAQRANERDDPLLTSMESFMEPVPSRKVAEG
ncbi:MAG: hypothetical protein L6R42_009785 [Xanthoria sp. 1 TBL-2021]|nr:MAG: hypothetical protein L6R42_009785 [Xanthoria sp. 1 TBL-2021]